MHTALKIPLMAGIVASLMSTAAAAHNTAAQQARINAKKLGEKLEVGDLVFVHVDTLLFRRVASDTGSWTNHVGIVIDTSGKEPIVAESRIPLSSTTTLSRFVARSKDGRVAIKRLNTPLTAAQRDAIKAAALKRLWKIYDLGFNLHSRRQFCSRYVHEVVQEATGTPLGKVETLSTLIKNNPNANLRFWNLWYFGNIPWQRETITPQSVLASPQLHTVFDGYATRDTAM